jgi:hypothetical protein
MNNIHSPGRYWLSYYWVKTKDIGEDRPFETAIHKVRDGYSLHVLSTTFASKEMRYAGAILNVPQAIRTAKGLREATVPLTKDDVVIQCTRPPLNDADNEVKRAVDRCGGGFEQMLWPRLKALFDNCDRSEVALASTLRSYGANVPEHYRWVKFYQENKKGEMRGGRVQEIDAGNSHRKPLEPDLTIGYLVSIPHVDPLDFRFIAAFGMGGTETLWLAHILTETDHRRHLDDAMTAEKDCIWTIPFLVPRTIPYPYMTAAGVDFNPRREFPGVTKWLRA